MSLWALTQRSEFLLLWKCDIYLCNMQCFSCWSVKNGRPCCLVPWLLCAIDGNAIACWNHEVPDQVLVPGRGAVQQDWAEEQEDFLESPCGQRACLSCPAPQFLTAPVFTTSAWALSAQRAVPGAWPVCVLSYYFICTCLICHPPFLCLDLCLWWLVKK